MLIGSATVVTYKSDIAKLTINIDSMFRTLLFEAIASNVKTFPAVPTKEATERTTIVGKAAHGLVCRNSCFANTPDFWKSC